MKTVFCTILAIAFVLPAAPLHAQQTTVLVNAFENQTGDRNLDWIGEGLAALIAERLSAERRLYVFGRDERTAEYEQMGIPESVPVTRATILKIGWEMGADAIVTGRFSGAHDAFRVDARVLNLAEGSAGMESSADGRLDDVISMAASLSSSLARGLVPGSSLPESDYVARPPVPRSAFEAYVRATLAADPQRREELLQDAVRLHPQYPAAIFQLGKTLYLDSDYKESAALLERIPPGAPEYAPSRFILGLDYYWMGDYVKSTKAFENLPPLYDVLVDLGAALVARGDAAGAESAWRRAAARNAAGAEAAFNLAYLAFSRGEMDNAATRLRQFLQSHDRDAEALFLLGRVYERQGRTEDSRRVLSQALRQSPRLERWVSQPVPNLVRVRSEFDPTEVRLPDGASLWTEARQARRMSAREANR